MSKVRYSRDVDILSVELSEKPIDHTEDAGQFIVHVSKDGSPVLLEIQGGRAFLLTCLTSAMQESEATLP